MGHLNWTVRLIEVLESWRLHMIERCGIVDEVANGEGGEKMALH